MLNLENLSENARVAALSKIEQQSREVSRLINLFPFAVGREFFVGCRDVDKQLFRKGISVVGHNIRLGYHMRYCHVLNVFEESLMRCGYDEPHKYIMILDMEAAEELWLQVETKKEECRLISYDDISEDIQRKIVDILSLKIMEQLATKFANA